MSASISARNSMGINMGRFLTGYEKLYIYSISHSILAERAGFEPALGYYPKHAFQACDLNRSSTSPKSRQG